MIILKNITKNDNIIEADYFPDIENEEINGHIKVDVATSEVISYTVAHGYENYKFILYHAQNDLLRIAHLDPLPAERKVIWY
ncbi:MAG: hypothetical protein E7671_00730 [Ruminococcaceae bacterium]|nr:hypothetical protein [Oscillospiraceae bacterium]